MKLSTLVNNYLKSPQFLSLKKATCDSYENRLKKMMTTKISNGKHIGNYDIKDINVGACALAYKEWLSSGTPHSANENCRIFSIAMNYAVSLDLIPANPMARVKKVTLKPRKVMWSTEDIEKFLDVAYDKWEYRNAGLIFHMCYDWAQRPMDMANLKWSAIDFDKEKIKITQSKRGAEVELPIYEPLLGILKQQETDWGFQEYVAPHYRPSDRAYRPYTRPQLSDLTRRIKEEAGLPNELKMGDLRRTGITEMVEAGVDATSIMSVSGHKSVTSLSPYIKHTYKTAKEALDVRRKHR